MVWYVRKGRGARVRLPDEYGTDEWWSAYQAAIAGKPTKVTKAVPGTIAWLVVSYRASAAWAGLELSTQRVRGRLLDRLCADAGTVQASAITRAKVQEGLDRRAAKPEAANSWLKTIRQMLDHAVQMDIVPANVAKLVKPIPVKTGGHLPWTAAEVEAYEARHPVGTKARLAFDLLLYTGLRKSDIVAIGPQHLAGDVLDIVPHKTRRTTGVAVTLRVPAELLASIAATRVVGARTFVVTDYGLPFTANGFGNWFRDRCDEAGVTKSAHGLRKAGAIRDAERGYTATQLMAKYGWVNIKEAELYTRQADRRRVGLSLT
jgi:integrase